MIYNKSSHPIEVKKISIRLWGLRDEIEAAIERRIKECEAAGVPLYLDDIKKFYNMNLEGPLTVPNNVISLAHKKKEEDAMAAMMEEISEDLPAGEGDSATATFKEADEIMAEQKLQGLDQSKPNPILERPYVRQAPDIDRCSYGFTLMSDINMDTILIFTKNKFLYGQSVVMEFLIPQNFIMTADVTYCNFYALRSRIISSTKPDYRIQCRFSFSTPGERDTLRSFLKSIEPELPKKASKKEDDSLGV